MVSGIVEWEVNGWTDGEEQFYGHTDQVQRWINLIALDFLTATMIVATAQDYK